MIDFTLTHFGKDIKQGLLKDTMNKIKELEIYFIQNMSSVYSDVEFIPYCLHTNPYKTEDIKVDVFRVVGTTFIVPDGFEKINIDIIKKFINSKLEDTEELSNVVIFDICEVDVDCYKGLKITYCYKGWNYHKNPVVINKMIKLLEENKKVNYFSQTQVNNYIFVLNIFKTDKKLRLVEKHLEDYLEDIKYYFDNDNKKYSELYSYLKYLEEHNIILESEILT